MSRRTRVDTSSTPPSTGAIPPIPPSPGPLYPIINAGNTTAAAATLEFDGYVTGSFVVDTDGTLDSDGGVDEDEGSDSGSETEAGDSLFGDDSDDENEDHDSDASNPGPDKPPDDGADDGSNDGDYKGLPGVDKDSEDKSKYCPPTYGEPPLEGAHLDTAVVLRNANTFQEQHDEETEFCTESVRLVKKRHLHALGCLDDMSLALFNNLPPELLSMILFFAADRDPGKLIKMRRVSRQFRNIVASIMQSRDYRKEFACAGKWQHPGESIERSDEIYFRRQDHLPFAAITHVNPKTQVIVRKTYVAYCDNQTLVIHHRGGAHSISEPAHWPLNDFIGEKEECVGRMLGASDDLQVVLDIRRRRTLEISETEPGIKLNNSKIVWIRVAKSPKRQRTGVSQFFVNTFQSITYEPRCIGEDDSARFSIGFHVDDRRHMQPDAIAMVSSRQFNNRQWLEFTRNSSYPPISQDIPSVIAGLYLWKAHTSSLQVYRQDSVRSKLDFDPRHLVDFTGTESPYYYISIALSPCKRWIAVLQARFSERTPGVFDDGFSEDIDEYPFDHTSRLSIIAASPGEGDRKYPHEAWAAQNGRELDCYYLRKETRIKPPDSYRVEVHIDGKHSESCAADPMSYDGHHGPPTTISVVTYENNIVDKTVFEVTEKFIPSECFHRWKPCPTIPEGQCFPPLLCCSLEIESLSLYTAPELEFMDDWKLEKVSLLHPSQPDEHFLLLSLASPDFQPSGRAHFFVEADEINSFKVPPGPKVNRNDYARDECNFDRCGLEELSVIEEAYETASQFHHCKATIYRAYLLEDEMPMKEPWKYRHRNDGSPFYATTGKRMNAPVKTSTPSPNKRLALVGGKYNTLASIDPETGEPGAVDSQSEEDVKYDPTDSQPAGTDADMDDLPDSDGEYDSEIEEVRQFRAVERDHIIFEGAVLFY